MKKSFFTKIPRTRLYLELPLLIRALLKSIGGDLKNQDQVLLFEKEFASSCRLSHALAMSYARVALFYILKALNLPPGSEVLMTPITIADIVNVIHLAGLRPVFIDVEKDTLNVDPSEIGKKVTERSEVLLVTYLFGITPDMDKIIQVAQRQNLIIIEDFSQSFGCKYKGKSLGTFGRAGFCSLSWIKTISTFYGGMIITDDQELLNEIRRLSQGFPFPKRGFFLGIILKSLIINIITQNCIFSLFTYYILGALKKISPSIIMKTMSENEPPSLRRTLPAKWLYRFNSLQAWIGLEVLKTIKEKDKRRIENVETLLNNLSPISRSHLPQKIENVHNIYWRLPLVSENITDFQEYLFKKNIDTCGTSLYVCSNLKAFSKFKGKTPRAAVFKKNMTYIPVHPTLKKKDMIYIAGMINNYFDSKQKDNNEQKACKNKAGFID